MQPDRIEVSWDTAKSEWLVRIENGGEVLRRHCKLPKSADDQSLRASAKKTVEDEGYQADPSLITIRH